MYIYDEGCEESNSTDKIKRVFYTVELDSEHFVDIMIAEDNKAIYTMQNEDGSTVYGKDGKTYIHYLYDEQEAILLTKQAFEKEYKRKISF